MSKVQKCQEQLLTQKQIWSEYMEHNKTHMKKCMVILEVIEVEVVVL